MTASFAHSVSLLALEEDATTQRASDKPLRAREEKFQSCFALRSIATSCLAPYTALAGMGWAKFLPKGACVSEFTVVDAQRTLVESSCAVGNCLTLL